ncbi:hypothetical protein PO909_034078 [Leuciscus waleckii]
MEGLVRTGGVMEGLIRAGGVMEGLVRAGGVMEGLVRAGGVMEGLVRAGGVMEGLVRAGGVMEGLIHGTISRIQLWAPHPQCSHQPADISDPTEMHKHNTKNSHFNHIMSFDFSII